MTLPPDVRAWPEEAVDELRERAAIMEVLGRMPRARADREAEACVRRRWARGECPSCAHSSARRDIRGDT